MRSHDRLAHTIIRAAHLVVSCVLACRIFMSWVPSRLDSHSVIADDLTHMDFTTATLLDQNAHTSTLHTHTSQNPSLHG